MSNLRSKAKITVTLSEEMKKDVREGADDRSMSMSEYIRVTMLAGRKQILALEEEMEGGNSVALEEKVLNVVPTDPEDALSHEEISEQVLEKIEKQVFELLDTDDRITHSAAHGGYYIE